MTAELDYSTGKAGVAYVGKTPWHGCGQRLAQGADLLTWQQEAGLDWRANEAVVEYRRSSVGLDGEPQSHTLSFPSRKVLYRSDTGCALSVVGKDYKVVQPREVIEFYRDLTERHGFKLETAGSLRDGRRIWALANCKETTMLPGNDRVDAYLLLSTSYDGTTPTTARFTSIRVVCANTLELATTRSKAAVSVLHSTTFDADAAKVQLHVGDSWTTFTERARALAVRKATKSEVVKVFLSAYYDLTTDEEIKEFDDNQKHAASAERLIARLTDSLFNSPGADLASARGTLWGAVNAVTYDIDHLARSRSSELRFEKAVFGNGAVIKQRAFDRAMAMV